MAFILYDSFIYYFYKIAAYYLLHKHSLLLVLIISNHFIYLMWRTQYDDSVLTWSPQGKIMQIDYAMEAVKQGSVSIGLRSTNSAVLIGLKRSPHPLAGHQEKVFKVDSHLGIALSGITADGSTLLIRVLV